MSQGIVFYGKDTLMIPFFIYKGIDNYTVSFDINQKYTATENEQIHNFKQYLTACNLKNFINNNTALKFDITTDEYSMLIKLPSPVTNMSVKNTTNINTVLNDMSWYIASPTPKGGRRKTKRKLKRKSQTRVRRRR